MDLRSLARCALRRENVFDAFCAAISDARATDLRGLKRATRAIGDAWEAFCCAYLNERSHEARVLSDAPDDWLRELGMSRRDVGIDIVARDPSGNWCAVQCKFRRRGRVSWRELATFEALCARTGPWHRHVVMTNQSGVRREGEARPQDATYARGSFLAMPRHEWEKLAGYGEGHALGGAPTSMDDARRAFLDRLARSE